MSRNLPVLSSLESRTSHRLFFHVYTVYNTKLTPLDVQNFTAMYMTCQNDIDHGMEQIKETDKSYHIYQD